MTPSQIIESGMNSAQFYKAVQEQHSELVPVIDHNKSAAFDAVLQKCRELGMADNYNVPVIDNVIGFIEDLHWYLQFAVNNKNNFTAYDPDGVISAWISCIKDTIGKQDE